MDEWRFWMPAEPIEPDGVLIKGERKHLIRGIASTESEDKHGERMILAGMDFSRYIDSGHLNDDHMPGEQHILGKPIEAKIVPDASKLKKSLKGAGFYHVVELYDTEPGRAVWDNMKAEKDDPKRQRGFSVEGAITETKGKDLTKTIVEDVALTRKPANTDTFASLVKSLTAGETPLVMQNLDDTTTTDQANQALTGVPLDEILWGTCKHNCYDKKGRFRKGAKSAYFHLVKCKDVDEDEAFNFVSQLKKAGYLK
jgi:hypothetical protein